MHVQLQVAILRRSNVTATLNCALGCVTATEALKWKPIWSGSLTPRFLNNVSPRWNSSAELLARHEYSRMSSSLSGKLQKAMRSCSCSGTGGNTCSTSSNGMNVATQRAANSVSVVTGFAAQTGKKRKWTVAVAEKQIEQTKTYHRHFFYSAPEMRHLRWLHWRRR